MSFADVSVPSTHINKSLPSSLACLAVAAALCLHASSALADDTAGDRLFREGRALMLGGRFAEACPKLEESQRLEPHVGTLLNLAACHERQGKVGSAWVEYQKAATAARAEGQTERAQLAAARIKVLEPRVPWLRIASSAEDVTLALDGSALEHAAWGQEMPVDPAAHVVTADRRGAKVFEERVELREGEHRAVRVEIVEALPEAGADAPAQDRVIVEPTRGEPPSGLAAKHASPWVFEPGILFGLVGGTATHPRGLGSDDRCSRSSCGELEEAGGVAVGANIFAGYALTGSLHLGVRLLVAPGLGANGAGLYGVGPSIAFRASNLFTIGAWTFFGNATLRGKASATSRNPDGTAGLPSTFNAEGDLHGGFGAGIELSLHLFDVGRGEVVLDSTPFFMASSYGTAACLPIGLAYRFQ